MGDDSLGVKPSFDTTDFKTGVDKINEYIRRMNSAFDASSARLGDWSKSSEGLEMRIAHLGSTIDAQKQKVAALTTEHARLVASEGENSKAAIDMELKLNKAIAALGKMENELEKDQKALLEMAESESKVGNEAEEAGQDLNNMAQSEKAVAKEADHAGQRTKLFGNVLSGLQTTLKATLAAIMAIVAAAAMMTAALVGMAASTIQPASDLSETLSKTRVVFGENAEAVIAFGEAADNALGMSENAALSAAATYGNLFRSMGFTTQASADMSVELVKLAGDLASFNNMGTDEVLEKLRAGLTGETEPLKTLGVNMNEAALKAKALSLGLIPVSEDTTKVAMAALQAEKAQNAYNEAVRKYGAESIQAREANLKLEQATQKANEVGQASVTTLTAQQKAQAAYAIILEQTSLAQGDFSRTSTGLANQQRIMAAQFENLKAKIGTAFLPIVTDAFIALNKLLDSPAVQAWVSNLVEGIGQISEVLKPLIDAIGNFDGDFAKLVETASTVVQDLVTSLASQVPALIKAGTDILLILVKAIITALPSLIPVAVDILLTLVKFVVDNLPLLANAAIQMILALVNGISQALPTLLPAAAKAIVTITQALVDNLPMLIDAALALILALAKGLVAALPVLLQALPTIVKSLTQGIRTALPMISKAAGELIMVLAMGIIANLPLLLQALGEIIRALYTTLGPQATLGILYDIGKGLVDGLIVGWNENWKSMLDQLSANFRDLGGFVGSILAEIGSSWAAQWGGVQSSADSVLTWLKAAFADGMEFLREITGGDLLAIGRAWRGSMQQVQTLVKGAVTNVKLVYKAFTQAMTGDWYGFGQSLGRIWKNTWATIGNILQSGWNSIRNIVSTMVNGIINFFQNTDWGQIGRNIIDEIVTGWNNAVNSVYTTASNLVAGVLDSFLNIDWGQIGEDIIDGLVDGLNNAASWLYDAITAIVTNLVNIILGIINGAGDSGQAQDLNSRLNQARRQLGDTGNSGAAGVLAGGNQSSIVENFSFYAPVIIGGNNGQRMGAAIKRKRY